MTSTRTKRQKLHFERSCKCKNHEVIVVKYNENPFVCTLSEAKIIPENHMVI